MEANVVADARDFQDRGVSAPWEVADGGGLFVMTEPPYTGAPLDPDRGRVLRVFKLGEGLPVPPDE